MASVVSIHSLAVKFSYGFPLFLWHAQDTKVDRRAIAKQFIDCLPYAGKDAIASLPKFVR
jgi:hypothetical protein